MAYAGMAYDDSYMQYFFCYCMDIIGVYRVDKSIGAGAYIVKYIVLPMIVQAIAITICYFYMKHDEADIKHKNYVVTGMIYVCVGVIAFTYCTIYPLILIPCVTIIATALFADQELTVWSGVAGACTHGHQCCEITF